MVSLFLFALTCGCAPESDALSVHPLEPLTEEEIRLACTVVRQSGKAPATTAFPLIQLEEPTKAAVLSYKRGERFERRALLILYDQPGDRTSEVVVDLREREIVSWREQRDVQPWYIQADSRVARLVLSQNDSWQESLERRGVAEQEVRLFALPVGPYAGKSEKPHGRRSS